MAATRTLALVLRTVDVFETSLVATLFTRDLGKVACTGQRCTSAQVAGSGWT